MINLTKLGNVDFHNTTVKNKEINRKDIFIYSDFLKDIIWLMQVMMMKMIRKQMKAMIVILIMMIMTNH